MPTLDRRFGLSASEVGTLLATLSASSMLASRSAADSPIASVPSGSRPQARSSRRRCCRCSGWSGTSGSVYALLVVGGLGSAAFHPAAAAAARRMLPERASFAISLFSAGGTVGMAAGPMAMVWLIGAGIGFTPLPMIPGIALAAVLWIVLPDERAPARASNTAAAPEERLDIPPRGMNDVPTTDTPRGYL